MTDPEILERCAAAGLTLRGIERRGRLLLLVPQTPDDLPDVGTLRTLAASLREGGVRWVSLRLEPPR